MTVEQEELKFPSPSNLCSHNYQPSPIKNISSDEPAKCPERKEKEEQGTCHRVGERGSASFPQWLELGKLISFHAVDLFSCCSHASRCQPSTGILISHYENSLAPQRWVLHCWSLALCLVPWQWSPTGCPKLSHPW